MKNAQNACGTVTNSSSVRMVGDPEITSSRQGAHLRQIASAPSRPQVAQVQGVGVLVDGKLRQADAQP
jgi:hypothetical protein